MQYEKISILHINKNIKLLVFNNELIPNKHLKNFSDLLASSAVYKHRRRFSSIISIKHYIVIKCPLAQMVGAFTQPGP